MADRCLEPLPLWNSMNFLLKVDSCQQSQGICIVHGCVNKKHSFQTETQVDMRPMCFVGWRIWEPAETWHGEMWWQPCIFRQGFRDNASYSLIWHTAQLDMSWTPFLDTDSVPPCSQRSWPASHSLKLSSISVTLPLWAVTHLSTPQLGVFTAFCGEASGKWTQCRVSRNICHPCDVKCGGAH